MLSRTASADDNDNVYLEAEKNLLAHTGIPVLIDAKQVAFYLKLKSSDEDVNYLKTTFLQHFNLDIDSFNRNPGNLENIRKHLATLLWFKANGSYDGKIMANKLMQSFEQAIQADPKPGDTESPIASRKTHEPEDSTTEREPFNHEYELPQLSPEEMEEFVLTYLQKKLETAVKNGTDHTVFTDDITPELRVDEDNLWDNASIKMLGFCITNGGDRVRDEARALLKRHSAGDNDDPENFTGYPLTQVLNYLGGAGKDKRNIFIQPEDEVPPKSSPAPFGSAPMQASLPPENKAELKQEKSDAERMAETKRNMFLDEFPDEIPEKFRVTEEKLARHVKNETDLAYLISPNFKFFYTRDKFALTTLTILEYFIAHGTDRGKHFAKMMYDARKKEVEAPVKINVDNTVETAKPIKSNKEAIRVSPESPPIPEIKQEPVSKTKKTKSVPQYKPKQKQKKLICPPINNAPAVPPHAEENNVETPEQKIEAEKRAREIAEAVKINGDYDAAKLEEEVLREHEEEEENQRLLAAREQEEDARKKEEERARAEKLAKSQKIKDARKARQAAEAASVSSEINPESEFSSVDLPPDPAPRETSQFLNPSENGSAKSLLPYETLQINPLAVPGFLSKFWKNNLKRIDENKNENVYLHGGAALNFYLNSKNPTDSPIESEDYDLVTFIRMTQNALYQKLSALIKNRKINEKGMRNGDILACKEIKDTPNPVIEVTVKDGMKARKIDLAIWQKEEHETHDEAMLRIKMTKTDFTPWGAWHNVSDLMNCELRGHPTVIRDIKEKRINVFAGEIEPVFKKDRRLFLRLAMKKAHRKKQGFIVGEQLEQALKSGLATRCFTSLRHAEEAEQRQFSGFLQNNFLPRFESMSEALAALDQCHKMFDALSELSYEKYKGYVCLLDHYNQSHPYTKLVALYTLWLGCFIKDHAPDENYVTGIEYLRAWHLYKTIQNLISSDLNYFETIQKTLWIHRRDQGDEFFSHITSYVLRDATPSSSKAVPSAPLPEIPVAEVTARPYTNTSAVLFPSRPLMPPQPDPRMRMAPGPYFPPPPPQYPVPYRGCYPVPPPSQHPHFVPPYAPPPLPYGPPPLPYHGPGFWHGMPKGAPPVRRIPMIPPGAPLPPNGFGRR